MKKSEIIANILSVVSEETEIDREAILSSNTCCEVVDARSIAINMLYSKGIYPARLAKLFGRTRRGICYMIANFDARLSSNRLLEMSYHRVKDRINRALAEHSE